MGVAVTARRILIQWVLQYLQLSILWYANTFYLGAIGIAVHALATLHFNYSIKHGCHYYNSAPIPLSMIQRINNFMHSWIYISAIIIRLFQSCLLFLTFCCLLTFRHLRISGLTHFSIENIILLYWKRKGTWLEKYLQCVGLARIKILKSVETRNPARA